MIDAFHKAYYYSNVWDNTFWLGRKAQKCPLDLWMYQEIIFKNRPDLIIETGTADGGSALFMAHVCDLMGHGRVVTIDANDAAELPQRGRLTGLTGSSTSDPIVHLCRQLARGKSTMVILDSDHSRSHVRDELDAYAPLVSKGHYLIVEDTNLSGHPVEWESDTGPMEAVKEFLEYHKDFCVDKDCEKFMMTFNPNGYLKRIS